MREIVFAGFGGQGVLTAGLIVSQIALYKGFHATWMPAYGAAQRDWLVTRMRDSDARFNICWKPCP